MSLIYQDKLLNTYSVVMMGLDNAGKSTALYRMKNFRYCETIPTVGFNCEKIKGQIGKSKNVSFTIWDVGGQDKVRPLWRTYSKGAEAIIFVVDSSDRDSMEEAKMELTQITKYQELSRLPILILANKQDLPGAFDVQELCRIFNLKELNISRIGRIICACAITGDGLDEALECLYEIILKNQKLNKIKR